MCMYVQYTCLCMCLCVSMHNNYVCLQVCVHACNCVCLRVGVCRCLRVYARVFMCMFFLLYRPASNSSLNCLPIPFCTPGTNTM